MKHFLLNLRALRVVASALCVLAFVQTANAEPITREQAKKRAELFLQGQPGSRSLAPVQNRAKLAPRRGFSVVNPDHELYYVFNRGDRQGFVIATGDDSTFPVIGYTDEGEFDYTKLPENMQWWLGWMTSQLEDLTENPVSAEANPARRLPTHAKVETLCTTRWNQGSPYNDECPMYFNKGRSVTGCVATAMAQVLYYHRAKSVTETQADMPSYTLSDASLGTMTVAGIPAGSTIDWDNMLDSYGSSATAKQKKAVAELMLYCGVAVQMGYSNSSSGAYSNMVDDAFCKYFGYGSGVRYISTQNPGSDDWDATLYKEVSEGRPVYLSGSNSDGGHAFVCDGYENQCFHINWGWGGNSDGYYMLSKLNPGSQGIGGSSGGYSDYPEAVVGVEPENYSTRAMPISNTVAKRICVEKFDADGDGVLTFGEVAAVTDLGDAFRGQTITTFNELYNFTGLTTLTDSAFAGCTRLTSVKLPKHLKAIGAQAFQGCTALKTFVLPDELTTIGDEAFDGCKAFTFALPKTIQHIGDHAFRGCVALKSVELPLAIRSLGEGAFDGCTKLAKVSIQSIKPQAIQLGAGVFANIDLSGATLNVIQGAKAALSAADQWRDFGTIYEQRHLSAGQFAQLEANKPFYLYNVGTGRYLTKGEAYGTQAIVDDTPTPMRFELRKSAAMTADGVYYLYSDDTDNTSNHILFRTSSDGKVGSGVKATFVDGPNTAISNKTSWWQFALVDGETDVYTLQVPSGVAGYAATNYFGVHPDHASNYASPTYGTYSDISYADYPTNCQWMLVPYDEQQTLIYQTSLQLQNLLTIASSKRVDATAEQAVYDDLQSDVQTLDRAQRRLRKKLGFIQFSSDFVRQTILSTGCDLNGDGEISTDEAAIVNTFDNAFSNLANLTELPDLVHFVNLEYLAGNSFQNCANLTSVQLPENLLDIYYRAFMGCKKLTSITIPASVEYIGDDAFNGCTSLREVYVSAADPADLTIGDNLFADVDLAAATLYVPFGTAAAYSRAYTWSEFGHIVEVRTKGTPTFAELATDEDLYVLNLGQRRYICGGEAYGTQGVVGTPGFIYQLRRSSTMPADTYYLYAEDTGVDGKHVLFRTDSDTKVGQGVKTCFVDGTVSAKAYWTIRPVEGLTNVYTLQVPENQSDYVEGEYLGVEPYHETDYSYYTMGLYYDVLYDGNESGCQWAFISKAQVDSLTGAWQTAQELAQLIVKANARNIDTHSEQAVYDDPAATEAQLRQAVDDLYAKLHYIHFADNRAKTICTNAWDDDDDDQLSYEEAAAVTDLGTIFRSTTALVSFDELQYFTGLTQLPADAFRSCSSLVSIYLPSTITSVGSSAFTSCSALRYIAALNPDQVVDVSSAGLTLRNITVFVPQDLLAAYAENADWAKGTVKEYTGIPVVAAQASSRQYGRTNPKFTFELTGAPINGAPLLTVDAENTTPVGDYPIVVRPGTITTPRLQCQNGVMTIEPVPLTFTAKSYTRNIGEPNPEFEITYPTFRNREKAEEVLIHEPVAECDATPTSPAGEYEIRVSGAEARNYVFEYVSGTLTVVAPVGIQDITTDSSATELYDLSGRRIQQPNRRGLYLTRGKKAVAK